MARLEIQEMRSVPRKWAGLRDAMPDIDDGNNVLRIYAGGTGGKSSIGTLVVLHEEDLISVVCWYHNPNHGGQGWYHYQNMDPEGGSDWVRRTWAQLTDATRMRVLAHLMDNPQPAWVQAPGRLRDQYKEPVSASTPETTYKLVKMDPEGVMYSAFDNGTQYRLGVPLRQAALPGHKGGYYSYPTREAVVQAFEYGELFPYEVYYHYPQRYALLECEASGRRIYYGDNGKMASTVLLPVRVLSIYWYVGKNHLLTEERLAEVEAEVEAELAAREL